MALIKIARVRFATDGSMASITNTPGSAFRGAVEALIQDVASGIIANDPTIVQAAENAVSAALAAEDVAIHGERAIPQDIVSDVALWGVRTPRKRLLLWIDSLGRIRNPYLDAALANASAGGPILVVPVLGQSTATQAMPAWAPHAFSNSRVYQWNSGTGSMDPVSLSDSWIGSGIGRELARVNPGARVLIVPCGQGATGFTSTSINPPPQGYNYFEGGTWDRHLTADPRNLVDRAEARVAAALAHAQSLDPTSKLIGWVWDQGQNDRAMPDYETAIDDLIAHLRSVWGSDLPVVVGGLIEEWAADPTENAGAIMSVLRDTPRRADRCAYVAAPFGSADQVSNPIHATPWFAEAHGVVLAEGLRRAMQATPGAPPTLVSGIRVVRSGAEAIISWDAAPTRVTAYELDYSTDSGSTWTPASLVEPVRTDVTLTGLTASDPLWVRMRVVTPSGTSDNTLTVKG